MRNKKVTRKLQSIPAFASDMAENRFWNNADSTEYFSGKGGITFKMPRRTAVISLRLPVRLLARLKKLAALKDVAYQALLKIYLDEKIRDEIRLMHP